MWAWRGALLLVNRLQKKSYFLKMSDGGAAAAAPSPAPAAEGSKKKMLNINVGVLGHVDSGKTSLGTSVATSPQLSSEK